MSRPRTVASVLVVLSAGLMAFWGYEHTLHDFTDWIYFELGARSLVHYHGLAEWSGNRWDVYEQNATLQIGPPALWSVAAFEWMSPRHIYTLFAIITTVLGIGGVAAAVAAGRRAGQRTVMSRPWTIASAVVVVGIWGYQCAVWRHLDDAMALSLAAAAAWLIARKRPWWLIGILLGTSIAAKPWALILAPMILGLPRRDLARTTLVMLLTGIAWWGPFVIASPDTVQTLGHFKVFSEPGSVLHLLGFRGQVQWLRPTQFVIGPAVGVLVAKRRGWLAAPLAALAVRVLTDCYGYGYYGLGPILFALLLDCAGEGVNGLPTYTAITAVVEFGLPAVGAGHSVVAIAKLLWGLGVLIALIRRRPATPATETAEATEGARRPAAALTPQPA